MSGPTDYTTSALIKSIKRRAFLPAGAGLTNSDILAYATEELRSSLPSFLKGLREEYLVVPLDLSITSSTIAAPARAVGAALRTIQWKNTQGQYVQLDRIEPERAGYYSQTGSEPAGYYFEGNNLILVPAQTSGTVRLRYQQRPGELVLPTDCCQITAIGPGANQVTVSAVNTAFTNSTLVDLVAASPNFVALALDQAVTISGNTFTFSPLPSTLKVGDYIALAGQTPIPQLPTELHDLVAQLTAAKIAQAVNANKYPAVQKGLDDLKASMTLLLSPRSDGSARAIVHRGPVGTGWWWG